MATSSALVDTTLRHSVYLERLKSGETGRFKAFLSRIDRDIRRRLAARDITEFSRRRLERLLVAVDNGLAAIFDDYQADLFSSLDALAAYEADFEARALGDAVENYEAVVPAPAQVRAAVMAAPLSVRGADGGKLLDVFVRDWTRAERSRVIGAIRQGYFEGRTTGQILQVVRGTRANGYRDGVLAITNRNAEAIVRTSVQHAASEARQETWKSNDVVTGYRWSSTLDGRTSTVCRSLDGRVFRIGNGPMPPAHISCRSSTVAELDGRFSFLQEGRSRSSQDGLVSDQLYYTWLKKQPAAFQDDVLGPTRGKLLRNGGLNADQFARLNLNRNFQPLTLEEMREREPVAFARANL